MLITVRAKRVKLSAESNLSFAFTAPCNWLKITPHYLLDQLKVKQKLARLFLVRMITLLLVLRYPIKKNYSKAV